MCHGCIKYSNYIYIYIDIVIYLFFQTLVTPLDVFLKGLELHALLILPSLSLIWPKHPAQVKDMQSSDVLIKLSKLHMVLLWYLHFLVSSIVIVWT